MKKLISLLLVLTIWNVSFGQLGGPNPVEWSSEVKKMSDKEYDLVFKAKIEQDWYIYSQHTPDGGPLAMEFTFANSGTDFELVGETKESKTKTKFSEVFKVDEIYFSDKATLTQRIKLLKETIDVLEVEIFYQVCQEVCINQTQNFRLTLDGTEAACPEIELSDKDVEEASKLKIDFTNPELLNICGDDGSEKTLWTIFILGFIGGLLALLTPCVFPMIPLTVSFFTKQSEKKGKGIFNAVLYGLFIVVIYLVLSIPFHLMDSVEPEILNNISTNPWLNISFFAIFIFFAGSFFGYYELTLPSSWINKMDSASNIGGIIGIFFMALTLALVSFSCTGPILGSLLAGSLSADGSAAMQLTMGMAGFGVALALPFAVFAMFPNLLNKMPKSGGWLNTTKVVLGFIELALAFKFLSKADLSLKWEFLLREIFIGIWIVVFVGLALYLFGKIKFPHDGPIKKLSKGRMSFAILVTAFVIYLIPGVTNTEHANLKLISGFPPPLFYSIYEQESKCPLGLECYKDFEEGMAVAQQKNKPVLLDFTGWNCENCRKMEESVWSEDRIFNMLNDNYILISLYVDDKEALPADQQFKFLKDDCYVKEIETVGDKWSTFQVINFGLSAQPDYRLLTPDGETLLNCGKNTAGEEEYYEWLKEGLDTFNKK